MKDKMLFSFAFLLVLAMFVSCSKDLADGDDALGGVTLRIKARGQSGAASEMTVATPINLYVFDTAGQCVAYKSVASEKDISLHLQSPWFSLGSLLAKKRLIS